MTSPGSKPSVPTRMKLTIDLESSSSSVTRPAPHQHVVNEPPTKTILISDPAPSLPIVTPLKPSPQEIQPNTSLSGDEDCPRGQGERHCPPSQSKPPAHPPKPHWSSTSATTAQSRAFEHQEEGSRQTQSDSMILSERRESKQGAISSAIQQLASHGKHAFSAVRKELFPSRGN